MLVSVVALAVALRVNALDDARRALKKFVRDIYRGRHVGESDLERGTRKQCVE